MTASDSESDFRSEQAGVRQSAGGALLLIILVLASVWHFLPGWPIQPVSDADRISFVFRCELAVGFVLWAMIARVGAMRYFSATDIGGVSERPERHELRVARAALQNTVEQAVLAIIAHAALALALPADKMAVIVALVGLFVLGRIAYWFGYPKGAAARAFGFALTFYPTILALIAAVVLSLF